MFCDFKGPVLQTNAHIFGAVIKCHPNADAADQNSIFDPLYSPTSMEINVQLLNFLDSMGDSVNSSIEFY